jgi:uncharacterized protein
MPAMTYMELILTEDCNLRCSYCWEKEKIPHRMPEATALAAVDFLLEVAGPAPGVNILLFGGEPLLAFEVIEKLHAYATQRAAQCGKSVAWDMTTNGTLITEDKARWLAQRRVKYLLSIDGARDDHDRHRRFPDGRGSFDCLAEKLPYMKRHQPWLGAKMSVTPQTAANLRHNIQTLFDLGLQQFIVGHAHGVAWSEADRKVYEAALREACELYLEKRRRGEPFRMTFFEEGEPGKRKQVAQWGCGAGRGRFCVDSYGDLYGCSKLANLTGVRAGALPLGNVFQGFTKIENRGPLLLDSLAPRTKCAACDLRHACAGGCPAINFHDTGNIFLPDPLTCAFAALTDRVQQYTARRHAELCGEFLAQKET